MLTASSIQCCKSRLVGFTSRKTVIFQLLLTSATGMIRKFLLRDAEGAPGEQS
jgi:hypothetical protein